jgi:hypothetical protein
MPLAQSDRRFSVVTLARWSSVPMSDRPSVTADSGREVILGPVAWRALRA